MCIKLDKIYIYIPSGGIRIIIVYIKYINSMKFTLRKLVTIGLLLAGSTSGKYTEGMNPGIMMRLDQSSINGFKNAMMRFLPHYINHDLKLPESYYIEVGFGDILWGAFTRHISWTDVKYGPILTDLKDSYFEIDSTLGEDVDLNMIKIDFPAIQDWSIKAY